MKAEISAAIRQARLDQQMTEQQLADKCGISKGYILKAENDIGDIPVSKLRDIVEQGLGGKFRIDLEF